MKIFIYFIFWRRVEYYVFASLIYYEICSALVLDFWWSPIVTWWFNNRFVLRNCASNTAFGEPDSIEPVRSEKFKSIPHSRFTNPSYEMPTVSLNLSLIYEESTGQKGERWWARWNRTFRVLTLHILCDVEWFGPCFWTIESNKF